MAAASVRLSVFVAVFTHLFIAIIACPLCASTLPIPAGLQPGDHYYLLFFTAQTTGFSSDMATYNAIANDYAGQLGYASPGVTWHAFLSTTSESVVANIPTSAYPVYNISYGLPADLIASDPLSLATQGPSVPIGPGGAISGFNSSLGPDVWTGINPADLNDLSGGLGASFITIGDGTFTGTPAIAAGGGIPDSPAAFYAISDPLTVPVPEPATAALLVAALMCVMGILYRWKAHTQQGACLQRFTDEPSRHMSPAASPLSTVRVTRSQ